MEARYDAIGATYGARRQPDPRIAAQVATALDGAARVLNVGAGTGNYEPPGAIGIEPSMTMLRQRPGSVGPAVQAVAEHLPVADRSFDATLCTFTLHHWSDLDAGLAELRRVADRSVILLCEPIAAAPEPFWLTETYVPEAAHSAAEQDAPTAAAVVQRLEALGCCVSIEVVPVPADCTDGFTFAFWNRPEAYLDAEVRSAMSALALLPEPVLTRAMGRLDDDLESGVWDLRFGQLRAQATFDAGYRLLVAERRR